MLRVSPGHQRKGFNQMFLVGVSQANIYPFVSFYILFLFVIRYILYKAPGEKIPDPQNPQTKIYKREIKYIYIDSTQRVDMVPGTTNYKTLIDSSAALGNTLRPILKSVKDMVRVYGWLNT